jgi:hypothetical protein
MAEEEKEGEKLEVSGSWDVEFYAPEDTPTVFSDGAFVFGTGNEFIISFYQTQVPALTDELKTKIKAVRSKCVARVVVTPFQMRRLVNALQSNLEKYDAKQAAAKQPKETGEE